jgi:hypothetical protein
MSITEISTQTARAMLKLVPNLDAEQSLDRKGFSIFIGSVFGTGLLALLMINTAANQDAFILADLKDQLSVATEEREATLKELQRVANPDNLSKSAQKIGMIPSSTPKFIYLPGTADVTDVNPAAVSSTESISPIKNGIR